MTANLAQTEIRYTGSHSTTTAAETRQVPPVPIRTQNVCLDLVPSTRMGNLHPQGASLGAESDGGWIWAASDRLGNPLGFLTLSPKAASPECISYFGPQLELTCPRDVACAQLVPEIIGGLIDWLRIHDICMALYADHPETDEQLAKWLVAAGFLYTGCCNSDGKRQMICLL